jgi:hypothetical protein
MRRQGGRRFCPACGADVLRPERRRAGAPQGQVPDAESADGPQLGSPPAAPDIPEPRIRATVWPTRTVDRSRGWTDQARPAAASARDSRRRRLDAFDALDAPTRRKLLRLGGEIVLLTAVIAVVYGGPVIRGGAAPSTSPRPSAAVASLAIAADEITAVFSGERFGAFTFADAGSVDGAPFVGGRSADGATELDLAGPSADLRVVTMRCELGRAYVLDAAQRRHLIELTALFAPDALAPLLTELDSALGANRESRWTFAAGRVAVRLEVPDDGAAVTVLLVPAELAAPSDVAG